MANTRLATRWRFNFKEAAQKFVLTSREKRVALFIIAAFLLGLSTKFYRDAHPVASPPPSKKISRSTAHRSPSTPQRPQKPASP
ncbi:MAG: hypothetical protein ABI925_12965 [Verrucomicrobiota bacterium]